MPYIPPPPAMVAQVSKVDAWRRLFDDAFDLAADDFKPIRGERLRRVKDADEYGITAAFDPSLVEQCVIEQDRTTAALECGAVSYIGTAAANRLAQEITAALPPGFKRTVESSGAPQWYNERTRIEVRLIAPQFDPGEWAIAVRRVPKPA